MHSGADDAAQVQMPFNNLMNVAIMVGMPCTVAHGL